MDRDEWKSLVTVLTMEQLKVLRLSAALDGLRNVIKLQDDFVERAGRSSTEWGPLRDVLIGIVAFADENDSLVDESLASLRDGLDETLAMMTPEQRQTFEERHP